MVDCVLVNAPWHEGYNRCGRWGGRTISASKNPPLYFLYAAAILEKYDYSVVVIDALAENLSLTQVASRVMMLNAKLIVVETNCASIEADLECAEALKGVSTGKVGLSGLMATTDYHSLMSNGFLDFCILGEYDYTILKMLQNGYWKHIDGLAYRDSITSWRVNPKKDYIENMDALPYPAYHLVDSNLYDEIIIQKRPFRQTISARACPYNCSFCISDVMFGKRWRAMSAKRIVDEMEFWQNKGIKEVFWDDETFTVDKKRVFEMCNLIEDRGLSVGWSCLGRADTVTPMMLSRMGDANCLLIRYGFENANQNILDFVGKHYKVQDIINASKWTRDAGVKVHGAWMFVPPYETEEKIMNTVELAKRTCDTAQFTVCTPYFGTEYFNVCKREGWLLTEDWKQYLASDKSVVKSDVDLGQAVEDAYRSFYLRPSYLTKSLFTELKKGTLRDAINVGLKVLGVKPYWS